MNLFRRTPSTVAGRLQRKARNLKNASPAEAARITVAIMAKEKRAARRQRNYDRCLRFSYCLPRTPIFQQHAL